LAARRPGGCAPARKRSVWIWLPPWQQVLQCYDIPLAPDLNKARNVQTLPERRHKCSAPPSDELLKNPIIGIVWLLRPCRNRPHGRAAEQRDERTACDHSMTSSARASSDGGTVRPRALADLRLITSSYFVGSCTG